MSMEREYTFQDLELDLLFGALAAIVFNFFMSGYAAVAVIAGGTFLGIWAYYRKSEIKNELRQITAVFEYLKKLNKSFQLYAEKTVASLRVRNFIKRNRTHRIRHTLAH